MLHVTMTYLISLIACIQKQHKIKILDDVDALEALLLEIACSIRSTLQSDFDEIEQLNEEQVRCIVQYCSFADWFLACDADENNPVN